MVVVQVLASGGINAVSDVRAERGACEQWKQWWQREDHRERMEGGTEAKLTCKRQSCGRLGGDEMRKSVDDY